MVCEYILVVSFSNDAPMDGLASIVANLMVQTNVRMKLEPTKRGTGGEYPPSRGSCLRVKSSDLNHTSTTTEARLLSSQQCRKYPDSLSNPKMKS